MNALSALKYVSTCLVVCFLASNGPDLRTNLLPLAGAMVFITIVLVLFEMANPERAMSTQETVQTAPVRMEAGPVRPRSLRRSA